MKPRSLNRWIIAALFLALLPGFRADAADKLPFVVGSDQATGLYAPGQPVVFTVNRAADATAPVNSAAEVEIRFNNRDSVLKEAMPADEKTHAVRFTPPKDGWYVCAVSVPGEKRFLGASGIVVHPEHYAPSLPTPDDFDAFWQAQRARLAADPAAPKFDALTPEQMQRETENPALAKFIADWSKEGCTYSNLEIPCLDVQPVRGYYAKPKNAVAKGHPAILYFRAAGVSGDWCRSSLYNALELAHRNNAIVVDMNAHGMLNGQPQSYYANLDVGELRGYQTKGREDRDQFYFLGMYLRLLRAIDFVCSQPEWDGVHVICIGTSQGGGQALAAAGLDPRVTAVLAQVPALCDLTGPVQGRPAGWPGISDGPLEDEHVKKSLATARYFDSVNFCARSRAQTMIAVALIDTTCPAPGVFTAYNQLKPAKRIVTSPTSDHKGNWGSSPTFKKECEAFVLDHSR